MSFLTSVLTGARVENSCAAVLERRLGAERYAQFLELFQTDFEFDFEPRDDTEDAEWMAVFLPDSLAAVPACAELGADAAEDDDLDLDALFALINTSIREVVGI
jgi:hypothetical protein